MAAGGTPGTAPTVIIVGAGAAGIFTAYQINTLYPNQFNVMIFEAAPAIGGNVSSQLVQYGGVSYVIDAGAQFFYPNPQPLYVDLIATLGLSGDVQSYPAGFTIWDGSTRQRRLWIPSTLGGFARYTADDWARLVEFGVFVVAAALLNAPSQPNWALSVDAWLATLPLSAQFKRDVVTSFLYQFVSLPLDSIGQASAVYATTYFVRNIFGAPSTAASLDDSPTFSTSQSLVGLLGILQGALAASGVSARTGSPVTAVAPGSGGVTVTVGAKTYTAQAVVLACDPNTSASLLAQGGTASAALIQLLAGLPYLELPIVLQRDGSCWMPGDPSYWEAVTTVVNAPRQSVAFNAWFGPLRPPYDVDQQIPVFKSWGAPGLEPSACPATFFSHVHDVLLPTTTFVQQRDRLGPYQGQDGLFFVGGWTNWFDSQEAALTSAMTVAGLLHPSGQARMAPRLAGAFDPRVIPGRVKAWLEMVSSRAPQPHKGKLAEVVRPLG